MQLLAGAESCPVDLFQLLSTNAQVIKGQQQELHLVTNKITAKRIR